MFAFNYDIFKQLLVTCCSVHLCVIMWVYLVGIALFLCILHLVLNYNEQARLLRKIPGPKYDFLVGNGVRVFSTGGKV